MARSFFKPQINIMPAPATLDLFAYLPSNITPPSSSEDIHDLKENSYTSPNGANTKENQDMSCGEMIKALLSDEKNPIQVTRRNSFKQNDHFLILHSSIAEAKKAAISELKNTDFMILNLKIPPSDFIGKPTITLKSHHIKSLCMCDKKGEPISSTPKQVESVQPKMHYK